MSYQVLARKYRPSVFEDLVGQEHVMRALVNALDQDKLHHAYLFTGTRGVGKTTIARILARCMNCETGITSKPCGECSVCREILEGRSIDLIEVDAASRTGVDDTRELLDNVQYLPSRARFKVYLIDEIHMFSKSAFNALLKTLEEPPEHVKFLLATTDPRKLPVTVLSRCLQLNLRNMTPEKIVGQLQKILDQEQVGYEDPALWQLGIAADGSMRDALSLAEQAIAYGRGQLLEKDIIDMLGGVDKKLVHQLLMTISEGDAQALLEQVAKLSRYSPDYSALLADLLSLLHRVAVAQAVPDAIDNQLGDRDQVLDLASRITPEDAQLHYQIGILGRRDLPLSPDQQTGFEMTLLRMLAFRPLTAIAQKGSDQGRLRDSAGPSSVTPATGHARVTPAAGPVVPQDRRAIQNPDAGKSNRIEEMLAVINKNTQAPSAPGVMRSAEQLTGNTEPGSQEPVSCPTTAESSDFPNTGSQSEVPPGADSPTGVEISTDPGSSDQRLSGTRNFKLQDDPPVGVTAGSIQPESTTGVDAVLAPGNWNSVFAELSLSGVAQNLASNCILEQLTENKCLLRLSPQHASLWNKNYVDRIARALSQYCRRELTVEIELGEFADETPAQYRQRKLDEKKARALQAIQQDEVVQTLIENFNGSLDTESVQPI